MKRLTTNKEASEMSMVELAHNSCYVKDNWTRYRDYELDIDARELTRKLVKTFVEDDDFTCDEEFYDYINDCSQYGLEDIEGLIAVFYRNLWAMAELRERLKYYEDLEERGLFTRLPCKMGDTVYIPRNYYFVGTKMIKDKTILRATVEHIEIYSNYIMVTTRNGSDIREFSDSDFGETVFTDEKKARQALHEMEESR